ncbi:Gamma-crystallin-related, partial [Trinorchestia longiramus]
EDTKVSGPGFTRVYSEFNNAGYFYDFTDYVPDLRTYNFDNIIRSACQTGIWFYYDQTDYNQVASAVYWMHGIEYCGDFPLEFADVTSSLRYGGSPYSLNEDSFTLYQGELFTGSEFWSNTNSATLDYLDLDGSSLLLTGVSAWTFFTGTQYTGVAVCVYPSTDHDVGQDGTYLDLGIFASMADLGIPDNSIRSAVRGCYSEKVVRGKPLDAVHRAANGAMGVIR